MLATVEDILKAAKKLSRRDRKRIVEQLDESNGSPAKQPSRGKNREAVMKRFLARAGSAHSDYTDVSSNKSEHLADIKRQAQEQ